jgi:hypothetical protein
MRTVKKLFKILLLIMAMPLLAQEWARVPNLPQTEFSALEVIDGIIFTATGNRLYFSHDNGETWQLSVIAQLPLMPGQIKKFGNTLFIGMNGQGIYSAPFDHPEGPWTQQIGFLEVSSLVERDNVLYASSDGYGIYKRNNNGTWTPFMNGLPNYSNNVGRLVSTPESFIAVAGGNGTFYRYNFTANQWEEDYYYGTYAPGLQINDIEWVGNTLYVSSRNRLLRSDDAGNNWSADQSGLVNGFERQIYKGSKNLYTLSMSFDPGDNSNFTFLRKRAINAPAGSTWANNGEFLAFYTWQLRESGDKLFAAAHNGLYFKADPTLDTQNPELEKPQLVVYPNPSKDRKFQLRSSVPIAEISIWDLTGKLIQTAKEMPQMYDFEVPSQGIYLVKAVNQNTTQTFKIVAQ